MEAITRHTLAAAAADRFAKQYADVMNPWEMHDGRRPADILAQLRSLGTHPAPDAVDAVMMNPTWTEVPTCDECRRRGLATVIQLGGDDESHGAFVCGRCLIAALDLHENT